MANPVFSILPSSHVGETHDENKERYPSALQKNRANLKILQITNHRIRQNGTGDLGRDNNGDTDHHAILSLVNLDRKRNIGYPRRRTPGWIGDGMPCGLREWSVFSCSIKPLADSQGADGAQPIRRAHDTVYGNALPPTPLGPVTSSSLNVSISRRPSDAGRARPRPWLCAHGRAGPPSQPDTGTVSLLWLAGVTSVSVT